MGTRNIGILSVDFFVPPTVVTNQDLVDRFGPFYSDSGKVVDAEAIFRKTGIEQRHVVTSETNADLAVQAAIRIIEKSGVSPAEIDCCLIPTSTPSMFFPSTACLMQDRLRQHFPNIQPFPAFDLLAACAGSVYALIVAKALVADGLCQYVLVIGSEVLTKLCRWQYRGDWKTSVLFGDGAAGVLVGEVPAPRGFLTFDWKADGSQSDIARSDGFGTDFPGIRDTEPQIHLMGKQMYKLATVAMALAAEAVVEKAKIPWEQIKRVIPHQANGLMTENIAKRLLKKGLPLDRVLSNIRCYGNTSTASPFIVLAEEVQAGNIQEGDYVVISSAGSGLTWAACLLRW